LNYQVAPLTPGRYSVKGRFGSAYPQPGIRAESNEIAIAIVATSAKQLEARISVLAERIDVDACGVTPLLGFTGDPGAIPPLIDILYGNNDRCQTGAVDALRYLDPAAVEQSLLDALRRHGPQQRMIHFLIVELKAPADRTTPPLLDALRSADANARAASIEGLTLSDSATDPKLFPQFAAMLHDPVAKVRHQASIAVGGYGSQQALTALRPLVTDGDQTVSEQATIAVGWIAQAAAIGSETRREAIDLLRKVAGSGRSPASEQALKWLANVGAQ
jgi:HEAT repeat protein